MAQIVNLSAKKSCCKLMNEWMENIIEHNHDQQL